MWSATKSGYAILRQVECIFLRTQLIAIGKSQSMEKATITMVMASFLVDCAIISSSSICRGELSFLQPVHFCICWHDSAILTSYLFQQWPACVHVPNWKNVLLHIIIGPSSPNH